MKKNIIKSLLFGGCVLALASCDVNSWNDKLDGFEGEPEITNEQTIEYTLTDADYSNLAANSTNIALAAEMEVSADLKTVGSKHYFTDKVSARDFVPAFLSDPDFAYFTLSNGSAIKLTYNVAVGLPDEVSAISTATVYEVQDYNYQAIWDSEENYVPCFAPSKPASSGIAAVLNDEYPDGEDGEYMLVKYKNSTQEPVFGAVEPEPAEQLSDVLANAALDDEVEVKGVITAICARGYVLTDRGSSILVYYGSSFAIDEWNVGDLVTLKGTVSSYNKGFQFDGTAVEATKTGTMDYVYPTPKVLTGADFDQIITGADNFMCEYCQFTATVTVSGNYYNFVVDGAETAKGSLYQGTDAQKAALIDGETVTICGYLQSISGGKYCNFVITSVGGKVTGKSLRLKAANITLPTTTEYALAKCNAGKWSVISSNEAAVLSQADYRSMGQSYDNFSSTAVAESYFPTYLGVKYPYAAADDTKLVVYCLYSNKVTSVVAANYKFDGSAWVKDEGVVAETAQFVKNKGKWMYDPNVTITLPAGKGQELSTLYFQACTDWVWENIDQKKLGVSTKGQGYVTSYGNNEYYCGASAYQGNVDLRASKALEQYDDPEYVGKSEDEIVEIMKRRFELEVMPGALSMLHPDAAPIEGLDVLYTINFSVYTGTTTAYVIVYKVVGPGQFEFVSCTWND
ncbi:MAG: hypothetical protein ACI4A8_07405 [Muribaculaceae bacterium]